MEWKCWWCGKRLTPSTEVADLGWHRACRDEAWELERWPTVPFEALAVEDESWEEVWEG